MCRCTRLVSSRRLVDVPQLTFSMIDGHGDPNTSLGLPGSQSRRCSQFRTGLKFAIRGAGRRGRQASRPLEGLWWTDDMADFSVERQGQLGLDDDAPPARRRRRRTLRECGHDAVETKQLPAAARAAARAVSRRTHGSDLHLGPYADEGPTIARLHDYIDYGIRRARQASRALPRRHPPRPLPTSS